MEDTCQSPVIILTASRSGSTLLRFILDSHPDLACPPETGVGSACGQLANALTALETSASAGAHCLDDPVVASPRTAAIVRAAVDPGFGDYLRRRGKTRWCDKSLDNLHYADLIAQVYPGAQFLCLFRHCMDVIASGVEACPWGLHRFGYDPFVARHPGNSVAAIGDYWLTCANAIMDFQQRHPQRCHRVRYEDLVTEPETTAAEIFSFLHAEPAPGITTACFEREHEAGGSSDEKIWFTSAVTAGSMGRGTTVPVDALPLGMVTAMNQMLTALGYRQVDDAWNSAIVPFDPRLRAGPGPAAGGGSQPTSQRELTATARAIDALIRSRIEAQRAAIGAYWPSLAGSTIGLVIAGADGAHAELEVRFPGDGMDAAESAGGDTPVSVIVGSHGSWTSVLDGKANLITEISTGRIRCVNPSDPHRIRTDEVHAIGWLLGLTQVPLARAAAGAP
jgi:hypothetical protein